MAHGVAFIRRLYKQMLYTMNVYKIDRV